ncbi:hypothetical protein ANCCEY_05333 [Ancylostoma ceylanicum]|uniref:Acetyl-CoA hydrolase/transferase C-terminal domain-containing protein n=1 Tax=Ancylostoma ceylanicum TaxID=53326 RepID=A0A0D6LZM6_9BILA|nr:hypothetical protein ANCCEY_05333 [Ancylostoma ceylanicum]
MRWSTLLRGAVMPLQSRLAIPILSKTPKKMTADEAVSEIVSNSDLYVHNTACTPTELLTAICKRVDAQELDDLRLTHALVGGKAPFTKKQYYDELGYCSMGPNLELSIAPTAVAKKVIALVNPKVPRTHGNSLIHQSRIDTMVEVDRDIHGLPEGLPISDEEIKIGRHVADNLVDNGATLQLGIGAIPDACLAAMKGHKDLGIHTELLGDGVMDLVDRGVINNSKKSVLPGKIVTSFAFGTKRFYQFLHENPMMHFDCCSWTNNIDVIRANSKMTCINSGLEIDITGQVAADSIGKTFYSGFGGQVDFVAAAALTHDGLGKSIIALTSRTNTGQPKIVVSLKEGAGVVTSRGHVRYVVTEYGIANLYGKNVRQRAYALIQIAHPDDRERLEKESFERLRCMPSP